MIGSHRRVGDTGELTAIRYLQSIGIDIIHTNFSCDHGEIDIIGREGDITVFFEVKFRRGDSFGTPEEALTKSKRIKILKTIRYFCIIKSISLETIRFDLLALSETEGNTHVRHHKNIPLG